MRPFRILALAAAISGFTCSAQAAPIFGPVTFTTSGLGPSFGASIDTSVPGRWLATLQDAEVADDPFPAGSLDFSLDVTAAPGLETLSGATYKISLTFDPDDASLLGEVTGFILGDPFAGAATGTYTGSVPLSGAGPVALSGSFSLYADLDQRVRLDAIEINVQTVPEPASLSLLGLGVVAVARQLVPFSRRRRQP